MHIAHKKSGKLFFSVSSNSLFDSIESNKYQWFGGPFEQIESISLNWPWQYADDNQLTAGS